MQVLVHHNWRNAEMRYVSYAFCVLGIVWMFLGASPKPPISADQLEQNKQTLVSLKADDLLVMDMTIYHVWRSTESDTVFLETREHHRDPLPVEAITQQKLQMTRISKDDPRYVDVLKAYAFDRPPKVIIK